MKRIKKLQRFLSEKKIFGFIIDNPIDLFYLTGIEFSKARLYVDHFKAYIFVDGRYYEACRRKTALSVLHSENHGFKKFLQRLKGGKEIGFDANYTSYKSFIELSSFCGKKFSLTAMENPCISLRAIKEEEEINLIKKAALLNSRGMQYAKTLLKKGITEEEIAFKIELFFLKHGGQKLSFKPIVAFGANAAECHYHPEGQRKLKNTDCVLIDIGVTVDYYNSDLTRTFFYGNVSREIKKIYAIVLHALHEALKECRPGVTMQRLDDAARQVIANAGYEKYFPHALGHGVGLDIHEYPRIREGKDTLEENMVITIEPGIYLPGIGGVRLEELILITKDGYTNLTPKSLALLVLDETKK